MEKEWIGPWLKKRSEIKYDNPWIQISHEEVVNPNGGDGIYGVVHYKNLAIGIIPIDHEGNTWIVGQHRYPLNEYSWEIPEGGGALHVDPLVSAKRELLEEVGITANNWDLLIEMRLSNSVSDEKALIYVATDLQYQASEPEESEQLEIRKIPFDQLLEMAIKGEITDSMSVAAIFKLQLKRLAGEFSF
jgi:ADP-ribose pyrophosphatase